MSVVGSCRRSAPVLAVLFSLGASMVGCGNDANSPAGPDDGTLEGMSNPDGEKNNTNNGEGPTYHGEIAALMADNCVGCHTDGAIAPFALDTYESVKTYSGPSRIAMMNRTMPPWGVDNTGDCNEYHDARWMEDEEIDLFGEWVDAGMPEGEPAAQPPAEFPTTNDKPFLNESAIEVKMAVPYTPDIKVQDDYRCFILRPGNTTPKYLTGIEVKPGSPELVHHVVMFVVDDRISTHLATAVDAAYNGPGFDCGLSGEIDLTQVNIGTLLQNLPIDVAIAVGNGAGVNQRIIGGWAPGPKGIKFPQNTGLKMNPGALVIMQVHYNLANGTMPDQTALGLEMIDESEKPDGFKEGYMELLENTKFTLEPEKEEVVRDYSVPFADDYTIHGIFPHMHYLGQSVSISVDRQTPVNGEGNTCLMEVDNFDFDWQQFFFYKNPIDVKKGDMYNLTCRWNTTSRREDTNYGEGTEDEMCLSFAYVTR